MGNNLGKDLESSFEDVSKLLRARFRALDKREQELRRKERALQEENPISDTSRPTPSDVLRLNVGGTRIDVLRRTLTCIEGSMLASRFSGRWDDSLEKDSDGNFFIDQPPELFLRLIHYLRSKQNETPLAPPAKFVDLKDDDDDFIRMVEYYGMTLEVFPYDFLLLEGDEASVKVTGHPLYSIDATELVTLCLVTDGTHSRYVSSFELTIQNLATIQVGWINHVDAFDGYDESKGVGQVYGSIAFDCSRAGIDIENDIFVALPGVSVEEGSVLRCQNAGNDWYVNGHFVASYFDSDKEGRVQHIEHPFDDKKRPLPCISIKGKACISAIELYPTKSKFMRIQLPRNYRHLEHLVS